MKKYLLHVEFVLCLQKFTATGGQMMWIYAKQIHAQIKEDASRQVVILVTNVSAREQAFLVQDASKVKPYNLTILL